MIKQAKIVLSLRQICIAICFAVFVGIITTASSKEVTKYLIDQYVSIISIIYFCDIYLVEHENNTSESFYLQIKCKTKIFMLRILICEVASIITAVIAWCVLYMKTSNSIGSMNLNMIIEILFAYAGTALFFGVFSLTIANIVYNKWIGAIFASVIMAFYASNNSAIIPIVLNVFSFGYIIESNGFYENWWVSKIIYIIIAFILLIINVHIIKKAPKL